MAISLDYQLVHYRRKPIRVPLRLTIVLAVILFVASSAKVAITIASTEIGYKIAQQREKTVALDMQRRELELERSVLLKHDILSARARTQLALEPLKPTQARKLTY